MSDQEIEELRLRVELCKALGNPVRLAILEILADGQKCVAEIVSMLGNEFPVVSQHLSVLRQYGVIKNERNGRQVYYELADTGIVDLCTMLKTVQAKISRPQDKKRRNLMP